MAKRGSDCLISSDVLESSCCGLGESHTRDKPKSPLHNSKHSTEMDKRNFLVDFPETPTLVILSEDRIKNSIFQSNDGLTLYHVNIRSMRTNFDNFLLHLQNIDQDIQIIVLTEIWINDCETHLYTIPGYSAYFSCCEEEKASGVAIYVRDNISIECVKNVLQPGSAIKMQLFSSISIVAVYRYHAYHAQDFLKDISDSLSENNATQDCVIIGDMNIDLLKDDSTDYINILASHGFTSCINVPTRITETTESCIDHVFIRSLNYSRYKTAVITTDISDHCATAVLVRNQSVDVRPNNNGAIHFQQIDHTVLNSKLKMVDWGQILSLEDVDDSFNNLNHILQDQIKAASIDKKISCRHRKLKPWMTNGLLCSIKKRESMYRMVKKQPQNQDLKQNYLRYRNNLTNLIRSVKNDYYKSQLAQAKGDPKKQWKVINQITGRKQPHNQPQMIKLDGESVTYQDSPAAFADLFNDFFVSVGEKILTENAVSNSKATTVSHETTPTILESLFFRPTDTAEIQSIINNLPVNKAPGHDGITAKILKANSEVLTPILVELTNKSLQQGIFPSILKQATVIPIFKSGSKLDLNNYRPISLLPLFSKVIELCVKSRLTNFITKNGLLSKKQFGFQSGLSTEDALLKFTNVLNSSLDKGKCPVALFLDIQKAFDTVHHKTLLKKLETVGVRGVPLQWFENYLKDRTQLVRVSTTCSSLKTIRHGVPQGSVLGPVLFLLYINDFCDIKFNGSLFAFADDTALLYISETLEMSLQNLNCDLRVIRNWFDRNKMVLSVKKTSYAIFSLRKSVKNDNMPIVYHYNACDRVTNCRCPIINRATEVKYLGLIFDEHLRWTQHIDYLVKKLRRVLHIFYYLRKSTERNTMVNIYYALVHSVLQYGISCWGGMSLTNLKPLLTVQKLIIKTLAFRKVRSPSLPLFRELNVLPLRSIYIHKIVCYYHKASLLLPVTNCYFTRSMSDGKVIVPKTNTEAAHRYLTYSAPKIFNQLPTDIRMATGMRKFRKDLHSWLLGLDEVESLNEVLI